MKNEFNWRLIILGGFLCAIAAAATPFVVLKLGMTVDLTYAGMFLAAAILGRGVSGRKLAIQLNIIQTMISVATGVGFMVVVMAAFFYIKTVFHQEIDFNPAWWQMFIWLVVSGVLGVLVGILPMRMILRDKTLPWPTAQAVLSVAETLTDPAATEATKNRRAVLTVTTAVAGFFTFLRDGFGVITSMVGNAGLRLSFGPQFAAIGLGMLVPLSVGLSQLLGVWLVAAFGNTVGALAALGGTTPENWDACYINMMQLSSLSGGAKDQAVQFLTANCGTAGNVAEFLTQDSSHFKYMVQWALWPATAMMIAAALTSILIPVVRNVFGRRNGEAADENNSLADEKVPMAWIMASITGCVLLLVWITNAWFGMPWQEVLLAVAIQPIMIIAGLKVLSITGTGPVSLMANATQFLFGLIWPAQVQNNLVAAYTSASPQASSENVVPSFWVARRIGGKFTTLIIAGLIMIPVGAFITPIMFDLLEKAYGIGLNPGQLSAPTGLKIATLAAVMKDGIGAMPAGALFASLIAIVIGVFFEILLSMRKRGKEGKDIQRFSWVPIPAALGFALILPAELNLALITGSVIAAVWRKFSPKEDGSYSLFGAPLAAGLIAGEAIVGAILVPLLAVGVELLKSLF